MSTLVEEGSVWPTVKSTLQKWNIETLPLREYFLKFRGFRP